MTWQLLQRVDSDARKILDEAGWMWDQTRNASRRMQRRGEPLHDYDRCTEQDVISFEELDDHRLEHRNLTTSSARAKELPHWNGCERALTQPSHL